MRFRQRPTIVDAVQYEPGDLEKDEELIHFLQGIPHRVDTDRDDNPYIVVWGEQQEPQYVNPGDWIVKWPTGKVTPCRDQAFARAYEPFPENELSQADTSETPSLQKVIREMAYQVAGAALGIAMRDHPHYEMPSAEASEEVERVLTTFGLYEFGYKAWEGHE